MSQQKFNINSTYKEHFALIISQVRESSSSRSPQSWNLKRKSTIFICLNKITFSCCLVLFMFHDMIMSNRLSASWCSLSSLVSLSTFAISITTYINFSCSLHFLSKAAFEVMLYVDWNSSVWLISDSACKPMFRLLLFSNVSVGLWCIYRYQRCMHFVVVYNSETVWFPYVCINIFNLTLFICPGFVFVGHL